MGLAVRPAAVVGVGWEEILSHTRRVELLSLRSRVPSLDCSCRPRRRGVSRWPPAPLSCRPRWVSAACSSPVGRPRLHFPPSLHHTHGPPDHGSRQRRRRRRRRWREQQQQRLCARLLGPDGYGDPRAGALRRRLHGGGG